VNVHSKKKAGIAHVSTLILVLCVGLFLLVSATSIAGAAEPAGEVTLTIVFGFDPSDMPLVKVNKTYAYEAGASALDLLDHAVAVGDLKGYVLGEYGFPHAMTSNDDETLETPADWSYYWSTSIDGSYYWGIETLETMALEDGTSYQFIWDSWPEIPIDWSTLAAPTAGSGLVSSSGGGGGPIPVTPPAPFAVSNFKALFANISKHYEGTGEDWKALEMAAIGKSGTIDANAIIANAIEAYNSPNTTNLQRSILALTALGIDASQISSGATAYDLIAKLGETAIAHTTTNGQMFSLLAYTCGPYQPAPTAIADIDTLIDAMLTLQNADGGWSFLPGNSDADMTAMGITVLAPYRDEDPRVEAAIQTALATLKGMQLPSGGFAGFDTPGVENPNANSFVIIALSAAGIDAQTWGTDIDADATPLTALLKQANATLDGFLFGGKTNDMATEQGFRALIAYQGFKNTGAAYNVYIQASQGVANISEDLDLTVVEVVPNEVVHPPIPPTGDSLDLLMQVLITIILAGSVLALVGINEWTMTNE